MFPSSLTICQQKLLRIPQRSYCQGTAIPEGARGQMIMFATTGGGYFPAELALAGQYNLLVDAGGAVFTEQNHTINLRIEVPGLFVILELSLIKLLHPQWPGYDGWGAQVGTMFLRWVAGRLIHFTDKNCELPGGTKTNYPCEVSEGNC